MRPKLPPSAAFHAAWRLQKIYALLDDVRRIVYASGDSRAAARFAVILEQIGNERRALISRND